MPYRIIEGAHDPTLGDDPFNKHSFGLKDHVSPYDNNVINTGVEGIDVILVQGIDEDAFKLVLSMAVRATKGVDLTIDIQDYENDWEEMMKGGLQTALESQTVVFAVSGVSRTCTHQLVRSRRAAFHQQSQRASFMGNFPEVRMPQTVWEAGEEVRKQWLKAIREAHKAYKMACEADVAYQDARFILPEGTTTFIMCEYSIREFLAVYAYRACTLFQWEIREVFREMGSILVNHYPWLGDYVLITCEATKGGVDPTQPHACTFMGWEKVEGFCPFPWAKENNRTFRSQRHEIAPVKKSKKK